MHALVSHSDLDHCLRAGGPEAVAARLAAGAYVPQRGPLDALAFALAGGQPLLFEGTQGCGKTRFGEALAEAFDLPLFFFPCTDETGHDDLIGYFDPTLRNQALWSAVVASLASALDRGATPKRRSASKRSPATRTTLDLWHADHFVPGEVLAAFRWSAEHGRRCVLLIDEVDKLNAKTQYSLLQILARGYATIPRLRPNPNVGAVGDAVRPICILTSNDHASESVSILIRDRCLYCWFDAPTFDEKAAILRAHVPDVSRERLVEFLHFLDLIEADASIADKVSLRGAIPLLKTLAVLDAPLDAETINRLLCFLAKNRKAAANYRTAADHFALALARNDRSHIVRLVDALWEGKESAHA